MPSKYVKVLSPSCFLPERDTPVLASESVSPEPLAAAPVSSELVVGASESVSSEPLAAAPVSSELVVGASESVSSASEPLAAASEPVTVAPVLLEPLAAASVSPEPVPVAKILAAKYPQTSPGMENLVKKKSSWAHYAVLSKILDDKRRIWNENFIAKKARCAE